MAIDPRALRTFLAVCRAGSISAAARDMNISQPAVSVTVSQLETALSTSLFARARSGIVLTPAGIALRRRAEAMEALLAAAEQEVALQALNVAGPLAVGGTPGALATIMPAAVQALKKKLPRIELQIVERPEKILNDLLRSERLDFAIVTTGADSLPEDLEEDGLLRDPFGLIVGRENDHLPSKLKLSDLQEAAWVLPDVVGGFRRQVDALFLTGHTPTPRNVVRCDSLLTTKALVRDSDYVTILPRRVVEQELSLGVLRELEIEGADMLRTVGVRRLRSRHYSPVATMFLEVVCAASP